MELFCNTVTYPKIAKKCKNCGKIAESPSCFIFHEKYNCVDGFQCEICDKFVRVKKDNPSILEAKANHDCNSFRMCYICKKEYKTDETNHQCLLLPVRGQKFHSNLAFISVTYQELVTKCDEIDLHPLFVTLLYEKERGVFTREILADGKLGLSSENYKTDNFLEKNYFDLPELQESYKQLNMQDKYKKNGHTYNDKDREPLKSLVSNTHSYSVMERLVQKITSKTFLGYVFILENQDMLRSIVTAFVNINILPKFLRNGNQYFLASIDEFNITFLNAHNYLNLDISELIDMYKLPVSLPIFPHELIHSGTFGTVPFPDFIHYQEFDDTKELQEKKKAVYQEKVKDNVFDVTQELILYSGEKITIIALALLTLLEQLFHIQAEMSKVFKKKLAKKIMPFFSPFTSPCSTLAGFNYKIFRFFALKEPIYALNNEFGHYAYNCSKLELEYVMFKTEKYKDVKVYSPYSPHGVKRFKGYTVPDVATDTWAGWFNGCNVHGHYPCLHDTNATEHSINMYGYNYRELNHSFERKLQKVRQDFPEVEIEVMWECQWQELKRKKDVQVTNFLTHFFDNRPKNRLRIRDCLKGGVVECYAHYFDFATMPDKEMRVEDAVSAYPTEMLKNVFPTGKSVTLIGSELEKRLKLVGGKFQYDHAPCWGVVQVSFLVPQEMNMPYHAFKHEKVYNLSNCFRCGRNTTSTECKHPPKDRQFTDTMTLIDCEYLFQIGCKIVKVFEAIIYTEASPIFKEYLKFTSKKKLCASPVPQNVNLDEYCEKINDEMNYLGTQEIEPSMMVPNKAMRFIFKGLENSLFGKFSQTEKPVHSKFVQSQAELEQIFNEHDLVNYDILTSNVAQVTYTQKPPKKDLNSNSIISAYILSYSKIAMHSRMLEISKVGQVFHYSTDQIIYTVPLGSKRIFPNQEIYGYVRDVYTDYIIHGFCAMGPHFYSLFIENKETHEMKTVIKCRGINLTSAFNSNTISFDEIKNRMMCYMEKIILPRRKILQLKRKPTKLATSDMSLSLVEVSLQNEIKSRRKIVITSSIFESKPFGFISNVI